MDSNDQQAKERKKKQTFLREEIWEKGYDSGKFSEFLCSIKPEGTNIDVWTYQELQSAVKAFKRGEVRTTIQDNQNLDESTLSFLQLFEKTKFDTNPKLPSLEEQKSVDVSFTSEKSFQDQAPKINKSNISLNMTQASISRALSNLSTTSSQPPQKKEELFAETIKTNKAERNPLTDGENIVITVQDPEQVKGGVFSSAFVQYTIKTSPFGWLVKRRFNDFFWLRDTLKKLHPGIFIPPIPEKTNKNKFTEEVVRKRMFFFETFLNSCLEHEDLRCEKFLYNFLYVIDENQWKKIKDSADKLPKVTKVEDLTSNKGEVTLNVNPELNRYISLAESYCTETSPIYKKIRKLSKALIASIKQSSTLEAEIAQCFVALQRISNNFNKSVSPVYQLRFANFYSVLSNMMNSWTQRVTLGDFSQKQATTVHKNLFCLYKYSDYENLVFKEMSQAKAKMEEEYHKQARDLLAKKERLFASANIQSWDVDSVKIKTIPKEELFKDKTLAFEVMLANETQQTKFQRDMVAYLNHSVYTELSRGLESRCFLYNSNFEEFIKKNGELMNKLQTGWEDGIDSPIEARTRSKARAHLLANQSMTITNNDALNTTSASAKSVKK